MKLVWRIAVITSSTLVAVGGSVALVAAVLSSPARGERFIDALRIVVSWPMTVGILGFLFGLVFRKELATFLSNIAFIKLPGGAELGARQAPPSVEEAKPLGGVAPEPDAEPQSQFRAQLEDLSGQLADTRQQRDQVLEGAVKLLTSKQEEVTFWRFQYLSLFLVPITKTVLRWFANQRIPPTKTFYEENWKPVIVDPQQREMIFMVLHHHSLIEERGPSFAATAAGRAFLAFLDQL
jgi:hypothetical protein